MPLRKQGEWYSHITHCLSACQMRRVRPGSPLVRLTNSSCLSIHQWRCHSLCLASVLLRLRSWVCFSYHATKVTIILPGGLKIIFLAGFVMLIRCRGCLHVWWWVSMLVSDSVCVCLCVCVRICQGLAQAAHNPQGVHVAPVFKKYIITFQMWWMSPRWSMATLFRVTDVELVKTTQLEPGSVCFYDGCSVTYSMIFVCLCVCARCYAYFLSVCLCLSRSEDQELIYIIQHVHLCLWIPVYPCAC